MKKKKIIELFNSNNRSFSIVLTHHDLKIEENVALG